MTNVAVNKPSYIYILYIYILYFIGCGWTCNTCKDVTTCGSCAYKEGVAATPPCGCDIANGYFEDGEECSICSKGSYAIGNQCHGTLYIYIYI